jgi:hypothetical protein
MSSNPPLPNRYKIVIGGIQGPPGRGNDSNFIYPLAGVATVQINHGLNKVPSVLVLDSDNSTIYPGILIINQNTVELRFVEPVTGFVYFN